MMTPRTTTTRTKMTPRTRSVLRGIGYAILALVVLTMNLVAGSLLYLGTDSAREKLVAFAEQKLQPVFPGGFEIGGSEGSLLRGLVLNDVVMRDLDERAAVEIERLEVHYSLIWLIAARVQVTKLQVDGLTIVSQPLADGRDNLATMVVAETKPTPRALPVSVRLARVDVDGRFVALPANGSLDEAPRDTDVRATVHLEAGLSRGMVATIDALKAEIASPARATITASGGVHITPDPADMGLRSVVVRVDGDTSELRRRYDNLELSGPVSIEAHANGTMKDLVASITAQTTKPSIAIDGAAHIFADRAELDRFTVKAPFADVNADGVYRFDMTGHGKVHVDISDLGPLSLFGAPKMAGAVKLDGGGSRDAEHTSIKLKGAIDKLRIASAQVGHATLDVTADDDAASARIDGRGIFVGAMDVRTLGVKADATRKLAHLSVTARGTEGVALDVRASAVPKLEGTKLTRLDATLEQLVFRGGGTPWQIEAPARLTADLVARDYALDQLALVSMKQRITMSGRVQRTTIASALLEVAHFDLSQLAGVLSPGHVLPHSDISAKVEARGPFARPTVNATLSGSASGKGKKDLIRASATAEGVLDAGRLNAKVFATIGGQKTSAKVDMPFPLRPGQPIDASFDASVLLNPWFAELLVPKLIQTQPILLYSLGTTVLVQGSVTGTTSDPRVHVGARLRNWGAVNGHGQVGLSMEYASKKLSTSGTLTFSALPAGGGSGAGVVHGTAQLPVDLAPFLSGRTGTFLDPDAPWHAELKLNHVGIERVPFAAFAVVPIMSQK